MTFVCSKICFQLTFPQRRVITPGTDWATMPDIAAGPLWRKSFTRLLSGLSPETFRNLRKRGQRMMSTLASTYVCKQTSSVLKRENRDLALNLPTITCILCSGSTWPHLISTFHNWFVTNSFTRHINKMTSDGEATDNFRRHINKITSTGEM